MKDRRRGSHVTPVLTGGRFTTWWWLVVVTGFTAIGVTTRDMTLDGMTAAGSGFVLVVALLLLGELRPVASSHSDPDGVNLATAFVFAILLRWGPDVALASVTLATVVGEITRGKRAYAAIFNVAQYGLSFLAAWGVLSLLGWEAAPDAPASLAPGELLTVLLAATTYHLVNHTIVGIAIAFAERRPIRAALRHRFWWYSAATGAVLALSPLIVVVLEVHWAFLPLLVLPMGLTVVTAQLALERERRSLRDDLTGVANRARLGQLVDERLEVTDRPRFAAVCLLDLDRFKEVNDTFGHAMGDELLRAVATRLQAACREGDAVARLGGDEFALLLDVEDAAAAERALARIGEAIRAPYDLGGVRLEVELSTGVALLPTHGRDLETLLRRADLAMYEAKRSGELLSTFRPELDRHTPTRLHMLAELRRGLEHGELELHFQPQVALPDAAVLGVEALVRWQHPTLGLLPPDRFLPLVERTATMRVLTQTVLELALGQVATWQRLGLCIPVAVNVSLHDLADAAFADTVVAGLGRYGVAPSKLHLEVTEQALVSDAGRVFATLNALDAAGVRLSLDDFGTGHASLTRLKRLPVNEVKIDRQFIADMHDADTDEAAIVRSIIDLARTLGLRTVAEGVETEAQWRALVQLGCDAVQGWYVARAMEPEQATRWLRERMETSLEHVAADHAVLRSEP